MTSLNPTVDAAYRNFAELLLRRHRLLLEGRGESSEVEEVEDDLSALWEKLNNAQRESLNGMGSDLNWHRRRGSPSPKGRRAEDVTEDNKRLLAEAESRKDWHAVLHYLRACAPVLTTADIASRRAAAYAGIGLPAYEDIYRDLAGTPSHRQIYVPDTLGVVEGIKAKTLGYISKHRDPTFRDDLRWSSDVSSDEEHAAFLTARSLGVADEQGRLYSVLRTPGREIRDLGVWHQQIAVYSQESPELLWSGHPVPPLNDDLLAGRPVQAVRPPKEVLRKMETVELIATRERKRLVKGNHA